MLAAGVVLAAVAYFGVVRHVPDPNDLVPKGRDQTTVVLDRDGQELAKLFAEQDRIDVPLADMPATLRQAAVAVEDKRFYEHQGVDPIGILRALLADVIRGQRQGGSTITQQLVKNAFVTPERTLKRKVQEAVLAYRIEKNLSKDQILELYLNTIYFGHGAYGVESAARVYFGRKAADLDLAQSAMIVGVVRSPANLSPYLEPEAARNRRATVLGLMRDQGFITDAEHIAASATEVELAGLKPRKVQAPYFIEYVKAQLTEEFGENAVYREGLVVRTTLDLRMQKAAESAIAASLDRQGDPSAALVAIDPSTGAILAMVGGRDFASQQFNVAVQGRRQPGSSFKPFVLAAALDEGVSPEASYESGPATLKVPGGPDWKVTGAGGGRTGPMRLREATEKSVNSVFARLILEVGPEKTVSLAREMGITSQITPVPAIALGGHEEGVTPLEMAAAYGTLAAGGRSATPFAVADVKDAAGKTLATHEVKTAEALDPAVAFLTTDILTGVLSRGTGTAARIGRSAAGKTGTTQKYRDAWFAGYTPDLVAAVWVGYPEAQREMTNVHGRRVTGGSFPAEIWAAFMKAALKGSDPVAFQRPKGLVQHSICTVTGLSSTEYCPTKTKALFIAGRLPGPCDLHTTPTTITVPDLVGMTKEAAVAALGKLMLLVKVVEKEIVDVPVGLVASQSPKAGSVGTTKTVVTITVSSGVNADMPPTAQFTFSPDKPGVGAKVTFDASKSHDDSAIAKYVWEFGDGMKAEGRTASHAYAAPSPADGWQVTLWVTDDKGQTAAITKAVVVK